MSVNKNQYSKVKVEKEAARIIVPITSLGKPEIPDDVQVKWQKILDLIAELLHVPSALIMKLKKDRIEVYASSHTKGNPYHKNDSEVLGLGLYCETVVGKRRDLLVKNALESEYWKSNPDIKLNMISYLGFPITWNDGEIFGTFCVLDNKENEYSKLYIDILQEFKSIIESDLNQLTLYEELKDKLTNTDLIVREIHHRIKNHFNVLISSIRLQSKQINNESEFLSILGDITHRITAISLIHEKLYMSKDTSSISIKDYITELCGHIDSNLTKSDINLIVDANDIIVNQEQMLPIGLIIAELTTNSIKYAFHSIERPYIKIKISSTSLKRLSIHYEDNGVGLPEGFDFESSNSFGMLIIKSLIKQLNSEMKIINKPGFNCKFSVQIY